MAEAEDADEDVSREARDMIKMQDPKVPSREEVEMHELTHVPFRSWCECCVMGRGVEAPHRRRGDGEEGLPEMHLDYCFPKTDRGEGMTILVMRIKSARMTCATAVAKKGSTGAFAEKRAVAFLREVGLEAADVIVKTDQEPAVKMLAEGIARRRPLARTVVEESPVRSSASNGVVERAIQLIEMQMRVMRMALARRWEIEIPGERAIMAWMAEYAAVLLNRFEVGVDGKTAYERNKGKKANMLGMEFGEMVMFKRKPAAGHAAKLECLWEKGCTWESGRLVERS